MLVSQTSFGGKTSGGVAKCRLFSQAKTTRTVNRHNVNPLLRPQEADLFQAHLRRSLIQTRDLFEGGGGGLFNLEKTMVSVLDK